MASSDADQILHDFPPFFKVFKDGRIHRYMPPHPFVPAASESDLKAGVHTKDVVVSPDTGVSARIFFPMKLNHSTQKLPLLLHYHGGGFCFGSPFDVVTYNFLTSLVNLTNAIAVSVDYRMAPENPLPIAYDDSWAALQWIVSHSNGQGPEPWINDHADLKRVFLLGESAGANITQYVAVRAGATVLADAKIIGTLVVHPFFVCGTKEVDEHYKFMSSTSSGSDDDPKLNPGADPDLARMGCDKVLVCVAEKDWLRNRGLAYYETLDKSGWSGSLELVETQGEDHCFHMFNPNTEQTKSLLKRMADFIKA